MQCSFDYYKHIESPNMYLCNPDRSIIGFVGAQNRHAVLRFNDLSELTFTIDSNEESKDVYDKIETKRLIFVENIGWFQIVDVAENVSGETKNKSVTAESHQTQLKTRGFVSEERVYMFYNPNDPNDANYKSEDTGAIPSVIGQLVQQIGLKVDLTVGDVEPPEDYGEWTLIYVEPFLRFKSKGDAELMYVSADDVKNVCRTFKDETTYAYDFIVNSVSKGFEVVFEFDFLRHAIKVRSLKNVTKSTNIYLAFENIINQLSVTENAENIVTVLSCNGNDLDIRAVNPMGTNYIVDFDYYKKTIEDKDGKLSYPWMSKGLINALDEWKTEWDKWQEDDANREGHVIGYSTLVSELQDKYAEKLKIESQITVANLKVMDLQAARDQLATADKDKIAEIGKQVLVAETVRVGECSVSPSSNYNGTPFEVGEILNATQFYSEVSLTDGNEWELSGVEKTLEDLLRTFTEGEKDSSGDWEPAEGTAIYFHEATEGATDAHKSYCKLLIGAEVGLCKNESGSLSEEGDIVVRGNTFNIKKEADGWTITSSNTPDGHSVTLTAPYFYEEGLRYKLTLTDGRVPTLYCFYVSGFKRFTTYSEVVASSENGYNQGWYEHWRTWVAGLENHKSLVDDEIKALQDECSYIAERCNVQKYVLKKGANLYSELLNYWIEGEYTNESLAALESTTMSQRIDLARELMEAGKTELEKVSQPTFSMSVDAVNFIYLPEFLSYTNELELGRVITIEKDEDTHYRPALTSIEFDLDATNSFSLTFSTAAKLDETEMTFADLLNKSNSTSRTISANWSNLTNYSKDKEQIGSLLKEPLNRSLRAMQSGMSNQEFTIDETGILGRRYANAEHTEFNDEQVRMINNTIVFTDDNWESIKTALGKVYYDSANPEKSAYGLIAEVLVGELIMGESLKIRNSANTITLDENGISIKKSDETSVFSADTEGNLELVGKITASSGKIGGYSIGEKSLTSHIDGGIDVGMSSDTTEDALAFWASSKSLSEAGATPEFSVTNKGYLTASSGKIGSYIIDGGGGCLRKEDEKTGMGFANDKITPSLSSVGVTMISVGNETFVSKVKQGGKYTFTFSNAEWKLDGTTVTLSEYGITITGEPIEGDKIYVDYSPGFAFWAGGIPGDSTLTPKFSVTNEGFLNAQSAMIGCLEVSRTGQAGGALNILKTTDGKFSVTQTLNNNGDKTSSLSCAMLKATESIITQGNISAAGRIDGSDGIYGSRIGLEDQYFEFGVQVGATTYVATLDWVGFPFPFDNRIWITIRRNGATEGTRLDGTTLWVTYLTYGTWKTESVKLEGEKYLEGEKRYGLTLSSTITTEGYLSASENGAKSNPCKFTLSGNTGTTTINSSVRPRATNQYDLGSDDYRWKDVWSKNGLNSSSDKNLKKNIESIPLAYEKFFDNLLPVRYKFKKNESNRYHVGFIAQDVKNALDESGIPTSDFAGYLAYKKEDGTEEYGLRYGEFIALNTQMIQKLKRRVKELEEEIKALKEKNYETTKLASN